MCGSFAIIVPSDNKIKVVEYIKTEVWERKQVGTDESRKTVSINSFSS
jgi:hypothetical protein